MHWALFVIMVFGYVSRYVGVMSPAMSRKTQFWSSHHMCYIIEHRYQATAIKKLNSLLPERLVTWLLLDASAVQHKRRRFFMMTIRQTTLSKAFSWMKMLKFRLKFHRNVFLRVQLRVIEIPALDHVMATLLNTVMAEKHGRYVQYINKWCGLFFSLMHILNFFVDFWFAVRAHWIT